MFYEKTSRISEGENHISLEFLLHCILQQNFSIP